MQSSSPSQTGNTSITEEPTTAPTSATTTQSTPAAVTATDSAMEGKVKTFTVEGSPFKFAPNVIRVKKGDTVRITFKNAGGIHDFVIEEFDVATEQLAAGASETVEFTVEKAGTFEFYCSVANHRAMGMTGSLIVE